MNKATKIITSFLLLTLVFFLAVIAVEKRAKVVRRIYDKFFMDNWNHYLPCEKLPAETEVRPIIEQHQDVILKIEQVHPGLVGVDVEPSTCPGKADLLIWYAFHQNRLELEAILRSKTLFRDPLPASKPLGFKLKFYQHPIHPKNQIRSLILEGFHPILDTSIRH